MRYVALLRGVNVGGANQIRMSELKTAFEDAGMVSVRTYINSGNVVFETDIEDRSALAERLEAAVLKRSGTTVDLQLRDEGEIAAVVGAMPMEWTNDSSMKCDVVFLRPDVDSPEIIDQLGPRPGIEDALYVPGAVIWRIDRKDAARNRLIRIVGTPLYSRVTVRNCNTTRKLLELIRK